MDTYEKKYKDANNKVVARFGTNVAKEIFTDLYESEDERILEIIKHCIESRYLHTSTIKGISQKQCFAWLEKRGEKPQGKTYTFEGKSVLEAIDNINKVEPKFKVGDFIIKSQNSDINKFGKFKITGIKDDKYWYNEFVICKISEQDEWELVKFEPKFHEGDWIVDNIGVAHQIEKTVLNVTNNTFGYDIVGGGYFNDDSDVHLWTIQDAKEGDVLAEDTCIFIIKKLNHNLTAEIYCCLYDDGDFEFNSNLGFDDTCTYPATKEQRNLLFQKMKEAGYEWDSEKKELKKIEEKTLTDFEDAMMHIGESFFGKNAGLDPNDTNAIKEQANTLLGLVPSKDWSEEDAVNFNLVYTYVPDDSLRDWLKSLKNRVLPHPKQEWSEDDVYNSKLILATVSQDQDLSLETKDKLTSWFKSLKPQNHWKPSDKQMEALGIATDIHSIPEKYYTELSKLYFDLKKLKRD